MTETKVLITAVNHKGGKIVNWTEACEYFGLTNEQLKQVIDNGTMLKDKFFVDIALTAN